MADWEVMTADLDREFLVDEFGLRDDGNHRRAVAARLPPTDRLKRTPAPERFTNSDEVNKQPSLSPGRAPWTVCPPCHPGGPISNIVAWTGRDIGMVSASAALQRRTAPVAGSASHQFLPARPISARPAYALAPMLSLIHI